MLDLLFDVDTFLEFESTLRHFPDLDARLFNTQEAYAVSQVNLRQLTVSIASGNCNIACGFIEDWIGEGRRIGLTREQRDSKASLL